LVSAQINTLNVPDNVPVGEKIVAVCNCVIPDDGFLTILWSANTDLDTVQNGNQLYIWGKPGNHQIDAVVIPMKHMKVGKDEFDVIAGPILRLDARFTITGVSPPDPIIVDPIVVDPVDPIIIDPVDPAPFVAPGFTVLILKESSEVGTLPPDQKAIFTSAKILQYLTANTDKLPNGTNGFRIWDDDYTDLSNTDDVWQVAYPTIVEQSNGIVPWIAISDGKGGGFSGPLPVSIDGLTSLIEEYK
tara:strand:- start:5913 stop:6647 length:735 start_codon:yes stop_codon:yes gene_type:complete